MPSFHEAVSNENLEVVAANQKILQQLHQPVSSESDLVKTKDGLLVPDSPGTATKGEIEAVPGFNPTTALSEVSAFMEVPISEDLKTLPDAASLVYLQPETVCGEDNRSQISPATNLPWRWICKLFITFPNGQQFVGTGWFIGARTVMTAGHCVYNSAAGGWATQIEVVPGMNGSSRPYGSQIATSFRSVTGWTNDGKPDYDYGAIIMPNCSLGNQVGWFGFANLSDSALQGLFVNNSGYPNDKPVGTQWFNAGGVSSVTDYKIFYMIDTVGGQSGSPVWRFLNGERHAVGIHAYGGCPNSATRITSEVFNNMLAWRNIPC